MHTNNLQLAGSGLVIPKIFIDGSYVACSSVSGYGFVVEIEGSILHYDGGLIYDKDILNLKSLGSELYALLRAIEWSMTNGYKVIHVIYDSLAIVKVIEKSCKLKVRSRKGIKKFLKYYFSFAKYVEVILEHRSENATSKRKHGYAHELSRMLLDV